MTRVDRLWPGATIVCVGGGTSLTPADVEACRGRARVIAVNDAYRLAPWADVLYACDAQWWKWHASALTPFAGLRYSLSAEPVRCPGVQVLKNTGDTGLEVAPTGLRNGRNSGYQAINLAVHLGAARIVLLGYDLQRGPQGSHWFGEHPHRRHPPLSSFIPYFATLVSPLRERGIVVVNASRETALRCFPRQLLDVALASPMEACA